MAKYVAVRVPKIAYENLVKKQAKMEEVVRKITLKKVNIPLTKVITVVSETPINLPDDYVLKLSRRKKII